MRAKGPRREHDMVRRALRSIILIPVHPRAPRPRHVCALARGERRGGGRDAHTGGAAF